MCVTFCWLPYIKRANWCVFTTCQWLISSLIVSLSGIKLVKDIEATFQMWNLINIELIYFRSIFVCFKFFSVSNEAIFINISYVHHHIQLLLFTENTFFRFLKLYHCIRLYNKSNGLLL